MGSEPETVREANREKTTYDKTMKSIKIGVCEMQGWRPTMEDAAIVLPHYEPNTSLFGVLDGHGGSGQDGSLDEKAETGRRSGLLH